MKPNLRSPQSPRHCGVRLILVAAFMVIGIAPCLGQTTKFPYQALVARDGVVVRSGPGETHYSTDELAQNSVVQVWRHDPGGWIAIRPPTGSFSMVPETAIEQTTDERGRVLADQTQVWVGTRTGPVEHPLWQVKLKRDEVVEVLGSTSWPSPDGTTTTWVHIAPPAGEFRWVHRQDLQLPDEKTTLPTDPSRNGLSRNDAFPARSTLASSRDNETLDESQQALDQENHGDVRPVNWIVDPFGDEQDPALNAPRNNKRPAGNESQDREPNTDNSGWRRATRPMTLPVSNPSPPGQNSSNSASQMGGGNHSRVAALPSQSSAATAGSFDSSGATSSLSERNQTTQTFPNNDINAQPVATPLNEILVDRLGQLDNQLSMEIIKPVENWELQRLSDQLVQIQATATSEQERQQSLWLQSKLERLRATQRQLLSVPQMGVVGLGGGVVNRTASADNLATSPNANVGLSTTGLGNAVGSGVDPNVQNGSLYDAYGWLSEFHQDHGRGPVGYVLQDDQGRITHHLQPSPGFNLGRYVKSKVGVIGTRGYNQRLKLSHVTVDRVVVLESGDQPRR